MSRTITVECVWKSTHTVEVPDDFIDSGHLDDFPQEALEEMDATTAELTDWYVR